MLMFFHFELISFCDGSLWSLYPVIRQHKAGHSSVWGEAGSDPINLFFVFDHLRSSESISPSNCVVNQSDLRCEDCSVTAAMRNKHELQFFPIWTSVAWGSPLLVTLLWITSKHKCVWPKTYLFCITKLSPPLFNQEVMQKNLIISPLPPSVWTNHFLYRRERFDWIL